MSREQKDNGSARRTTSTRVNEFFDQFRSGNLEKENIENIKIKRNILARYIKIKEILSSRESFVKHFKLMNPDLTENGIEEKLKSIVSEKSYVLDIISNEYEGYENIKTEEPAKQIMAMMDTNYMEPSDYFSHIPKTPNICDQKKVLDEDDNSEEEKEAIFSQIDSSVSHLNNRYRLLTGNTSLTDGAFVLEELSSLKAPVPWHTGWSGELYSREAEILNLIPSEHKSQRNDPETTQDTAEITTADGLQKASEEAEGQDTKASEQGSIRCNIEQLFRLSGANPPSIAGESEPRYTFPGRLNTDEDIFYDYAVILPVKECPELEHKQAYEPRDFNAAVILTSKARGVVEFLNRVGLEDSLGVLNYDENDPNAVPYSTVKGIKALLDNVESLRTVPNLDIDTVRFWRKRLKSYAGVLRTISRTEINLAPLSSNSLEQQKNALLAAMNDIPEYELYDEEEILRACKSTLPIWGDVFSLCDKRMTQYLKFPGKHPDPVHPDAILDVGNVRPLGKNWALDYNDQGRNLRHYLKFLAGEFRQSLEKVKAEITNTANAIEAIQDPSHNFMDEFQKLASDLVYQSIFALAKLLDEICDNLALQENLKEGSKRLALMLVFRQHWFPAGYVQGKLVGYKNLVPNQSEKLFRKTSIKTTTETSSVEEFNATRKDEYSQTRKETSEFLNESSSKFNFTASASGSISFIIGSAEASTSTSLDLSNLNRSTRNQISEMTRSGSVLYNEKRELSLKEITEAEDIVEMTSEIKNSNQEITANYFYYQLLRQYNVATEFFDVRPVLLRAREIPSPAEIDEKFLSDNAHLLIPALPPQLSADLQESVGEIDSLARSIIRKRTNAEQKRGIYELARSQILPEDPEELSKRQIKLEDLERVSSDAWLKFIEAEETYLGFRARLDRVISHVRTNICYYMQFIWQGSPTVDHNKILNEETFARQPLPLITQGLIRQGFYGNEEIYDYCGPSIAMLQILSRNLKSGIELTGSSDTGLEKSPIFQLLSRKYHTSSKQDLIDKIKNHVFIVDPIKPNTILNERVVQIAQDALVVETMPGQIPLLEGFQMANRYLFVEHNCLENEHLRGRIADKTWNDGDDSRRVYRREGYQGPVEEVEP